MPEPWQGKIHKYYAIACRTCSQEDSVQSATLSRAEAFFLSLGWRKLRGGWRCPTCVKETTYDE